MYALEMSRQCTTFLIESRGIYQIHIVGVCVHLPSPPSWKMNSLEETHSALLQETSIDMYLHYVYDGRAFVDSKCNF